jgi:hypothetical protein
VSKTPRIAKFRSYAIQKETYADWLVETGFIDEPSDYSSTGSFAVAADVTTVTHQNVADLGFIRVVSMRCEPNCDDPNPDIYSVIENYRNFDDAAERKDRLASVTMEWTSAYNGRKPSNKFVVFYAFTGTDSRYQPDPTGGVGDNIPFQPNLDGRGDKAIPGLCNTCHGGAPKRLKDDGTYRRNGNTGSLFLAMDLDNFAFDTDPDRPELSKTAQESKYKNKIDRQLSGPYFLAMSALSVGAQHSWS